jgi:hypothetical protein
MSSSQFRKVALGLPETVEGAHQGHADFRVAATFPTAIARPMIFARAPIGFRSKANG